MKLVHVDKRMATSMTIYGSFRKPFKLQFDEHGLRENKRFGEGWDRNVEIEKLFRRRRTHSPEIMDSESLTHSTQIAR
jgi:hypothetical protein